MFAGTPKEPPRIGGHRRLRCGRDQVAGARDPCILRDAEVRTSPQELGTNLAEMFYLSGVCSTAYLRARDLRTCRCNKRKLSTLQPPRGSASPYRRRFGRADEVID